MEEENELKRLAEILAKSDQYRVIEGYKKPEFYNVDENLGQYLDGNNTDKMQDKRIGVFLDIEATGLSTDDKVIELGMVKFEYTEDGRIFRLLEEFNSYQDPKMAIPEHITKLTGITDNMVKGHQIIESDVESYLKNVDLIIAYNAKFDRSFFEKTFKTLSPKPWACLMHEVDWKGEDISSHKLEYIAYKYGFFYEGHRAVIDCLVGIHILAQRLKNTDQLVLKQLLTNSGMLTYKLWAIGSSYEYKDLLRDRGYRWNNDQFSKYKAWAIEIPEDKVEEEINYLRSRIYGGSINIPIDIFDAYERFSNKSLDYKERYKEKYEWLKALCIE